MMASFFWPATVVAIGGEKLFLILPPLVLGLAPGSQVRHEVLLRQGL
jgi:hypothetical protein